MYYIFLSIDFKSKYVGSRSKYIKFIAQDLGQMPHGAPVFFKKIILLLKKNFLFTYKCPRDILLQKIVSVPKSNGLGSLVKNCIFIKLFLAEKPTVMNEEYHN